jgi:hypothetical protein
MAWLGLNPFEMIISKVRSLEKPTSHGIDIQC